VAERLKAPDSKSGVRETVPWVQIPPLPPYSHQGGTKILGTMPFLTFEFLVDSSPLISSSRVWIVKDHCGEFPAAPGFVEQIGNAHPLQLLAVGVVPNRYSAN
jgi:hypothetical protein